MANPAGVYSFVSLASLRGDKDYAMNEGKASVVLIPVGNAEVLKFVAVGKFSENSRSERP